MLYNISVNTTTMRTGFQWGTSAAGFALMTVTVMSLAIFLAYIKKNKEELSLRILNVLYSKLAIFNLLSTIIFFVEIIWHQEEVQLTESFKTFVQIRMFVAFSNIVILLEISVCSLLRLCNSQLYMWASLNIPYTTYFIIQAFLVVIFQCFVLAGTEKAQDADQLGLMIEGAITPVFSPIIITIIVLQFLIFLR